MSDWHTDIRLLADIGGTNARFALETGDGDIGQVRVYACADYSGLVDAVRQYFSDMSLQQVSAAAIAIANPVDGDEVRMTNRDWSFSIEATRRALGFDTLLVVNDFTALAMALPKLNGAHWKQIGAGTPRKDGPIGVLGPGTGLGVSGLIKDREHWIPLASEGGHVTFSPVDDRDDAVLAYARQKWSHVSFERVAAGSGLSLIYDALAAGRGRAESGFAPERITDRAHRQDELAIDAIACFSGILGTLAGNLALTLGARGGVYVGGGVVQKLGTLFDARTFRQRFEQKGRFEAMLKTVPTYLITTEYPAFFGVSALLSDQLSRSGSGGT
ncbi:glucokinase [Burkholderia multivorans]|nr:glucokinase [Burkholderia multivorans]MCO8353443.1 glucokinase [Burkholderia multivorans]MCO8385702.1 glucokinase [Burkholderia multivorans]MCO8406617.1 glucokinase [Burkholderia multivorans]MCO8434798.1 glucokinase [Burkholderia multivorans]